MQYTLNAREDERTASRMTQQTSEYVTLPEVPYCIEHPLENQAATKALIRDINRSSNNTKEEAVQMLEHSNASSHYESLRQDEKEKQT